MVGENGTTYGSSTKDSLISSVNQEKTKLPKRKSLMNKYDCNTCKYRIQCFVSNFSCRVYLIEERERLASRNKEIFEEGVKLRQIIDEKYGAKIERLQSKVYDLERDKYKEMDEISITLDLVYKEEEKKHQQALVEAKRIKKERLINAI